jgi:hypothetical protein
MPDRRRLQSSRRLAYHALSARIDPALLDDPATIAHALAGVIDNAAGGRGPCILPRHAWNDVGPLAQQALADRAARLGVPLAVEWTPP